MDESYQDHPASERIIGHHRGREAGPLIIAIGGIHGNERAGVLALERLMEMLAQEPLLNPGFSFRGEILALRGNLAALEAGVRFIDQDLNRIWRPLAHPVQQMRSSEEVELYELLSAIEQAIEESPLSEIVLLDLHTTTAAGGIFAFTGDDEASLSLAAEMGVPVIKGMLSGMQGTTLHYFREGHLPTRLPVRAVTFESGDHHDPASVDLALAATVSLLRALGCVREEDVSSYHDELLHTHAKALPHMTQLTYIHRINPGGEDGFVMRPGYRNFQPVVQGELVADDRLGPVAIPTDGYLLMPLYQKQGDEGFFLIRETKTPSAY